MPPFAGMRPVQILLVEDNPGDARLAIEALKDGRVGNRVTVVADGEQALRFLHGEAPFTDAARPDLVLLDLGLPGKSGGDVLTEIRADPILAALPVAVLTGSAVEQDILRSNHLQVTSYITKPVSAAQLLEVVRSVADFWVTISSVQAPTAAGVTP